MCLKEILYCVFLIPILIYKVDLSTKISICIKENTIHIPSKGWGFSFSTDFTNPLINYFGVITWMLKLSLKIYLITLLNTQNNACVSVTGTKRILLYFRGIKYRSSCQFPFFTLGIALCGYGWQMNPQLYNRVTIIDL